MNDFRSRSASARLLSPIRPVERTLLVTGGAGFIGSNFLRHVLATDQAARVVNLDKLTYAGNPATIADLHRDARHLFVHGDITDGKLVASLLAEHSPDAIVHFAAESHVDRSIDSPEPFLITNVLGTFRLLEAARRFWKTLPGERAAAFRFLHVSTDEVYGTLSTDAPGFKETTPYAPNSPYAASKAASDHFARAYFHTYGLPVIATNCSNNYGPYQFPEKLIPLMILNALDGKPLPIYGDGGNVRDWLYVGDHCSAVARVLAEGRPGETYNVGGNYERTNLQIVDTLCGALDQMHPRADGVSYSVQKTFVADRPGHDRRYAIDSAKLQGELGWTPAESFESGLEKTIRWYLENRGWCEIVSVEKYSRERLGLA